MMHLSIPVWQVVARTVLVYLAVVVGLRAMGKRELGQMTVFDLVVLLLIANAVQNAMVGPDVSVTGGILAAFVLLAVNRGVGFLRTQKAWGRLVEGPPTVLVQEGRILEANLRREGIEIEELRMAMREHGVDALDAVKLAVLEIDGTVSIVPADARVTRTHRRIRQLHGR